MSTRQPRRREHRGVARARIVRRTARLVLVLGLAAVIFAPISWERLPDFGLVFVPPSDPPPKPPGPGIDPPPAPPKDRIIAPSGSVPRSTTGEFAYMEQFGSQPPYQSTCEPVPFQIRTATAPANGDDLIFEALQQVADASGLSFRFTGYTEDVYDFNEPRVKYEWENEREDLWIGWASVDEVPDFGPSSGSEPYAIGLGGPVTFARSNGQQEVLGGGVVLRAGEDLPHRFGPGANSGNVLLHEIGHALGLDHVLSEPEQMYPQLRSDGPDGYGSGDTRGLQGMTRACSP